jgi:regulator of replication initiation timing
MSDLTEIVDNLENRLVKLLQDYKKLEQNQQVLQDEITDLKMEKEQLEISLQASENRVQTLKAANALLGSNDYKKETKLKINGLIREIDQCIVQLSE